MFALSIFEDVGRRSDMVDAAELKQYLVNERFVNGLVCGWVGAMVVTDI